jgi:hypothetical protein
MYRLWESNFILLIKGLPQTASCHRHLGAALKATQFTELLDSQQQQGSAAQVEQTQQLHWKLRL